MDFVTIGAAERANLAIGMMHLRQTLTAEAFRRSKAQGGRFVPSEPAEILTGQIQHGLSRSLYERDARFAECDAVWIMTPDSPALPAGVKLRILGRWYTTSAPTVQGEVVCRTPLNYVDDLNGKDGEENV